MINTAFRSPFLSLAVGLLVTTLGGCGSAPTATTLAPRTVASASDPTAAVVAGTRVGRSDLWPLLAELGGREALEEHALDSLLRAQAQQRGIVVGPAETRAEEDLLLEVSAAEVGLSRDQAARALDVLRRERGLGPTRSAALLRRNATLRALVRDEVVIDPAEVQAALDVAFGEKFSVRLIVLPDEQAASVVRAEVLGRGGSSVAFSEAAVRRSIHPTGPSGGLLDPLSPRDPAVPATIRRALTETPLGQVSPVLALDRGFGMILVEARLPAGVPTDADRERTARRVRAQRERAAMDRVAQDLLARAGITVLDEHLRWGWEIRAGNP